MGMPDANYTNPTADFGWQHCLSVPRELHWGNGGLTAWPVRELEQLRKDVRIIDFSGTVRREVGPALDLELENRSCRLTVAIEGAAAICWEDGVLTLTLDEPSALDARFGRQPSTSCAVCGCLWTAVPWSCS